MKDLYYWLDDLLPRARQAAAGEGEYAAGDWCRFCPARPQCRVLAERQLSFARREFRDPQLMTPEDVARVLPRLEELVLWAGAVKDYAQAAALKGERFPGWKVVSGRANRRFTDDAEVARRVNEAGRDPFEMKLLSVTAMEKLLGKKKFQELLSDLTERPSGKPALVPEEDKRPELNLVGAEFREGDTTEKNNAYPPPRITQCLRRGFSDDGNAADHLFQKRQGSSTHRVENLRVGFL